jgi:hypothetical protein
VEQIVLNAQTKTHVILVPLDISTTLENVMLAEQDALLANLPLNVLLAN